MLIGSRQTEQMVKDQLVWAFLEPVVAPSPFTVKGMAARMLELIGDLAAHRGPLWAVNSRLIDYLKLCRVQLVILDDFHHLVDKETDRVLETVSDWLW